MLMEIGRGLGLFAILIQFSIPLALALSAPAEASQARSVTLLCLAGMLGPRDVAADIEPFAGHEVLVDVGCDHCALCGAPVADRTLAGISLRWDITPITRYRVSPPYSQCSFVFLKPVRGPPGLAV